MQLDIAALQRKKEKTWGEGMGWSKMFKIYIAWSIWWLISGILILKFNIFHVSILEVLKWIFVTFERWNNIQKLRELDNTEVAGRRGYIDTNRDKNEETKLQGENWEIKEIKRVVHSTRADFMF